MHTKPEIKVREYKGIPLRLATWIEQEEESYKDVYGEDQPANTECVWIKCEATHTDCSAVGQASLGMVCFTQDKAGGEYLNEECLAVEQEAIEDLIKGFRALAMGSEVELAQEEQKTAIRLLKEIK